MIRIIKNLLRMIGIFVGFFWLLAAICIQSSKDAMKLVGHDLWVTIAWLPILFILMLCLYFIYWQIDRDFNK
jgi:phage shock protein PspC (stress-responsive transcriptional regulator)